MADAREWIRIYSLAKEFRVLPYPGSLLDQPKGAMQRFEVIMAIREEDEERRIKEAESKSRISGS